jgi:hypothetical protein
VTNEEPDPNTPTPYVPDDRPIDPDAVAAGAWTPGPYGPGDRLGTYREVDDATRARALAQLDLSRPIRTFNLSDGIEPGYPGAVDRKHEQYLVVAGFDPGTDFTGDCKSTVPNGPNHLSFCEERITSTYNMSSKINGFAHSGVGEVFYDGTRGPDLVGPTGLTNLDVTTWGPPLLTRGILLDVVEHHARTTGNVEVAANGRRTLPGRFRVTVEDLEACLEHAGVNGIERGDAVLLRTGWINLARSDPKRFLRESPGAWLRETRWLADFRPALVATDSFMWGLADREVTKGQTGAGHQVLLVERGVRLGESIFCEELSDAGLATFVFCHAPIPARGAVSSNSPAIAIANVGERTD